MANHSNSLDITWDVGVAIARTNPIPLDSTQNHASLTALQTYAKDGATSYVGQQVNVVSAAGVLDKAYIIKNKNGDLLELATKTDIEALAGVFQFKGVAVSISDDQKTLTVTEAGANKGETSYTVQCFATGYEYDMDLYYGWGTDSNNILFWTDTPELTAASVQYLPNKVTSVTKVVFNGEDYYLADTTVPTGDGLTQWENVSGQVIYTNDPTSGIYSRDNEDSDDLLGTGSKVTYEAYDFVVLSGADAYVIEGTGVLTPAASDNTGYVYQIGENEYASNGHIWVKLGAPVEDWILI